MRIILIHKAEFHKRPPVISVLTILKELNYDVTLITCGISDHWKKKLKEEKIEVFIIPTKGNDKIMKLFHYFMFRWKTKKILKRHHQKQESLLWVEGAYTLVSLGAIIKKYNYILQIQELHENTSYQLRAIKKVIYSSKAVFMPEYNRAILYQVWFKLKKRPYVLPNKPYFLPNEASLMKLSIKYNELVSNLKDSKIILYQGLINSERDLSNFVRAVKEIGDSYKLVILGKDYGILSKYKDINPDIIHIDFLPAPDYLFITSLAHIGIVTYDPYRLNTTYCAPNKIFEYSSFGVPMIGNDVPGLFYPISNNNAGIIVDSNNVQSIIDAIHEIDNQHDYYSENSRKIYDSIDNKEIIRKVLEVNIIKS